MKPTLLFLLAGMFFVVAGCLSVWTWYSAALTAAPECAGVLSLFAENPRCRWPTVSHYGMKASVALMLLSLLFGLILRRKQES